MMVKEYTKTYLTKERFDNIVFNNPSCSSGTVGMIKFDKYLHSKGFLSKGIRNTYNPRSVFWNPITNEALAINYSIKLGNQSRQFYMEIGKEMWEVPQNKEEFKLFEDGKLKLLFS